MAQAAIYKNYTVYLSFKSVTVVRVSSWRKERDTECRVYCRPIVLPETAFPFTLLHGATLAGAFQLDFNK